MIIRFLLTNIFFFISIFISFAQTPNAEVLKYQTDITAKRGSLLKSTTCDIKINNREGDEYTEISIPFSKLNKVSKLNACIKNINGEIIKKLSFSDVKDRSSFPDFSFYADNMVKEFTIKHNTYPYILSYSYQEQSSEFLNIDSWRPIINWKIPTINASLSIEVPIDYKISFKNYNTSDVKIDTVKDIVHYSWQSKYEPIDKPEIFMPDVNQYYPHVEVVPLNFIFDIKGSFNNWETFGNWEYNLNENLSDLPEFERNKIKSLTSGIANKLEQIRILYHYLQDETRYISINIKTGGMKPFPASFVSENKYGDCKALANYMKSMLNVIGITAYCTDIYGDDNIKNIDKSFPSQQFNHVILNIPLDKDTVWLDCTSDGSFNYLGTFTQNRDAFLFDKDKSHFVKTPALKFNDVLDTRKVEFSEKVSNEIIAKFENTYRSNDFSYLAYITKSANENRKTQIIYNNYIENGFDPIDFKIVESPRDSSFIKLIYNASTTKIYNQYGDEKMIHLIAFDIPDFKKPSLRKYPVQIDFPVYKSDTLNYYIPQSYSITNKLDNLTINSEFGKYSILFVSEILKLRVIKSFSLNAGTYSLKQYPAFYDFIKKVTDIEKNTMIITTKKNKL